ncbi:endonuclease/exonuclease/phosphatase family protein [Nocardioides donggukensis]|uniref:Endonuclease/exonuclease/phosphatase domain-containing protein n=1 Tax=Nocardioides donggukensis TaxID=2774019 RepID=A0A927Q0I1_9ACTN|nr:endonuclease/exonuclease/phosphatase family protein [Nocardioides donggukensis]MBD8870675.1 hypothetical protein [Nocardioides donggukensis]
MLTTKRPRAALAAALATALTATLTAGLVTVTAPVGAAAEEAPGTLRIGTYNIRSDRTLQQFSAAVDAFKPRVDVAGLQEIGANVKNHYLQEDRDWGYYRPPQIQQNPVIWRRSVFDHLGSPGRKGYYRIARAREIEGKTGGLERKDPTFATVVRLRDRASGTAMSVINVHLISGAVKGGRRNPERPRRFELFKRQMKGLARLTRDERAKGYDVYALGDFNAGYKADFKWRRRPLPFRRFKAIGFKSMWHRVNLDNGGTRNDAYIDQVWNETRPEATTVAYDIRNSDHFPAIATYSMPEPPAGYAPERGSIGFRSASVTSAECHKPWQVRDRPMRFELEGRTQYGYATVETSGTAKEGVDYTVDDSSLYDGDPDTNHIDVLRIPDVDREPHETFTLRLVGTNTDVIADSGTATGTIRNDDGDGIRTPDECRK